MMNIVSFYMSILHKMAKLVGMQPKSIEIEASTVLNFWVPSKLDHKKKKPPLILLHGFAGNGLLTWHFQALSSSLRKHYTLYIPDLLFFGGSQTASRERSPRFQADCVAKGLRKLGIEEKCVVVGFSYGGFVGFQMAEHHPDLVGSMVVTGSVLGLSESVSNKALERIEFSSWPEFLMPNSVEGVKVLLDVGSYNLPWLPKFFYKHYLEVMFGNRKEKVELLEALVVRDEDVTNHEFQQRIYMLWGYEDKIFNMDVANNLKERLGGKSKLQCVKKAGHLVILERPNVFNKHLKAMLASLVAEQQMSS